MTSRIRFSTAAQVFEAFPSLGGDVRMRPGDETPIEFLRRLTAGPRLFDPIAYCAYLLPRRETVWWGLLCVRAVEGGAGNEALRAAEAWVRDPDEALRRQSLALWQRGDRSAPSSWLACAVGQSGGSVAPEGSFPIPAKPQMTAIGVRTALVLAVAGTDARVQGEWVRACIDAFLRFAEGGECRVTAPAMAK